MAAELYTIHARRGSDRLRVVGPSGILAIVPPVWAAWHGAWLLLIAMIAALWATATFQPALGGVMWLALIVLSWADGDTLRRWELRLRGWREVGCAEAGSEAGAEELYVEGRAVEYGT